MFQPNSDLLGMIQILTIVFGEEPPVYSRSQTAQPPAVSPYPNQTPYPTQPGKFQITPLPLPLSLFAVLEDMLIS